MVEVGKEGLRGHLLSMAREFRDPAGREVRVLADEDALVLASRHGCGLSRVYHEALEAGICPYRYVRNRDSVSLEEQLSLARGRVAVVGAGGLGGHVILLLARIGVGSLVVVDCDVFDETNLNRQALCRTSTLQKSKAGEAAAQVRDINPGVEVTAHPVKVDDSNIREVLAGAQVAVDALDNVRDRLILERGAKSLQIPLVHGALAGFDGQVMTVFPEDRGLSLVYGRDAPQEKDPRSPEAVLGVPALMPCLIATLEAAEVLKILLGRGSPVRNSLLHVDLLAGEMNRFVFA
ncbi:MAG: ThiF family adenylyltransferase [Thermodesulfobacteriota bacterium]